MSYVQDVKLARYHIGKSLNELPVPAFVLDKSIIKSNISKLKSIIPTNNKNSIRVSVQTMKCVELLTLQLEPWNSSCVYATTVEDLRHLVKLVEQGIVTDVLFATPVGKSQLKELAYLKNLYGNLGASIHILIDDVLQLQLLHNHSSS
jgi:D-serine deaminase-like pyridoxal phosphate-dependent protein